MTELELRNFIKDNKVEWSFIEVGDGCVIDVIMFIEFNLLPAFLHLISNYLNTCEYVDECCLRTNCIVVNVGEVCEFYDIEIERVFTEDLNFTNN